MRLQKHEIDSFDSRAGQLSEEVAKQSHQLIEVLDTINDRVYLKDIHGRVTYANQAFLKTFDLSADEVLGKHHEDFLPSEMIQLCDSADKKVLELGEPICLVTNWHDSKGTLRWSETLKSPLHDDEGNITGTVGVSRDTTARHAAEEELNRQKKLLELIIETVPDWIFVKDTERRIILANRAFYIDQGLDPKSTLGREPTDEMPKEVQEKAYESDTYVLRTGQSVSGEIVIPDPDDNTNTVYREFRKLPLQEDNNIIGIVAMCRDLSEAKRAEEQSKRNESLLLHASRLSTTGELVAGIAHEVNQPLFSILNYAKAVENALQDIDNFDVAAVRKWVQQIHKEAARGGKITQRLKSFVRRSDAQQELADLNQVVVESLEFLTMETRDASLTIETQLADNLSLLALDSVQIQQVLVNLLKNSLEALQEQPETSPRVLITTRQVNSGIEVAVADNGPGISADAKPNIFDAFQTTKHDGLGLGLAISKTIVEAHQGNLTYQTNDWGGVTFSFTLQAVKERGET